MWGRKGRRSQQSDIGCTILSASIVVAKGVFAAQNTQQKLHEVGTRVQEEQHPLWWQTVNIHSCRGFRGLCYLCVHSVTQPEP